MKNEPSPRPWRVADYAQCPGLADVFDASGSPSGLVAGELKPADAALIVAAVVSHNAEKIRETGVIVFAIVVLHNAFGYLAGLTLGLILKFGPAKTKALSVEIGMQNSGLATGLAQHVFATAPLAAVPGAIFSVWHNISGAILAEFYKRWENGKSEGTIETAQT